MSFFDTLNVDLARGGLTFLLEENLMLLFTRQISSLGKVEVSAPGVVLKKKARSRVRIFRLHV